MKKLVTMILITAMAFAFTACSAEETIKEVDEVETEVMDDMVAEEDADVDMTLEEDSNMDAGAGYVEIGEGETVFDFTVTFQDGTLNVYKVSTDETTVGAALVEVGLIEGEDSEYGLYVTTVDGVTLDWDADAAYWALYIDGDAAMSGVDTTEIVEGSTYSFAYAQ